MPGKAIEHALDAQGTGDCRYGRSKENSWQAGEVNGDLHFVRVADRLPCSGHMHKA